MVFFFRCGTGVADAQLDIKIIALRAGSVNHDQCGAEIPI